jgi:hypothetical protein
MSSAQSIPGYTYGKPGLERSPVSLEELELLKNTVLFTSDDVRFLRMSREVLADQVDAVLDVWYGFVGSNPHLVRYFSRPDGQAVTEYLARVRPRFGQWILDTASANYDQQWLDYQHEIGLRHTRAKKNRTDSVDAVDHISFRYIPALIYPICWTLIPFLSKKGHSREDVDKMHQAWVKSVILQVILGAERT